MGLHNLKPAEGSVHKKGKRLGRGQGSGRAGTSGRGHNGAKSRSGYSKKIGFEGGQMPLQRRVPKFGFKNINRKEYVIINLDTIQEYIDNKLITDTLDISFLREKGITKKGDLVKVLGRGELKSKVEVKVHKVTKSAQKAIESNSGKVTLL